MELNLCRRQIITLRTDSLRACNDTRVMDCWVYWSLVAMTFVLLSLTCVGVFQFIISIFLLPSYCTISY